jgi:hypothetical protein
MNLKTLITTVGLGAGLMYFLDPQQGTRRRALVRDKANGLVNQVDGSLDTAMEDVGKTERSGRSRLDPGREGAQ